MIKAIIFDFDGVLIESAEIKTQAFRELFSEWPDKVDEVMAYHLMNTGLSRYLKFRYFYESLLGKPYTEEIGNALSARFSALVLDKVKSAPFVMGALEFIKENHTRYILSIASGTPQDELVEIMRYKDLAQYFTGIYGAPSTKTDIIRRTLQGHSLSESEAIFVGDGDSDRRSATESGIPFILRLTRENQDLADTQTVAIHNLTELKNAIERMES
jgi:phosphoglycolate phosphatase-like HAD superfamily hydrolase